MTRFYPRNDECVEWVPYTVNPYPVGLVTMLSGKQKQFVARVEYQTDVTVPGKIHPNAKNGFWTSLGSTVISHGPAQQFPVVEVLAIDVACTQLWVVMETESALPQGALVGGQLNDGTPLYTARFLVDSGLVYGYYNPQTRRAHGEQRGIRSSTTCEVLVVLEPRIQLL